MNPVIVLTSIAQRRQKLVNQIAVRRMDLEDAEASLAGPARGRGKSRDNLLNAVRCEGLRHRIGVGEG